MFKSQFSLATGAIAFLGLSFFTLAFGATVNCPTLTEGSISSSSGYSKSPGSSLFGINDGALGNTLHRAYVWWDLTYIPAGTAIENAELTYGWDRISFYANSRRVLAGIIPADYDAWNASSLSSQFNLLNPGNASSWIDETYSSSTSFFTETVRLRSNDELDWLFGRSRFGLAFRTDESDALAVDDTTLLSAYRHSSGLKVTYVFPPTLSGPANGGVVDEGDAVPLSWSSDRTSGGGLRYLAQYSDRSDFAANVSELRTTASSWTIGVFAAGQRIYWRVRVEDATSSMADENHSDWSVTRHFDVIKPTCRILPGTTGGGSGSITFNPTGDSCSGGQMRCFDGGTTVTLTAVPASGSVFERWYVDDQDAGTQNPIQVVANNENYTAVTAKFNLSLPEPPAAPFAITSTDSTINSFRAKWRSSTGATGYRLDVSTSLSFTMLVSGYANLEVGNVTNWVVAGLSPGTDYHYRVRAYNTGGTSPSSNSIIGRTLSEPTPQPVIVFFRSGPGGELVLNWPAEFSSFTLEYNLGPGPGGWNPVTVAPAVVNGQCWIMARVLGPGMFFRLRQ